MPTGGTATGAVVASTAASTSTVTSPPVTASKTTTGKTLLRRPSVIIHKRRHWYIMSGAILKWCPQKFPDPRRLARILHNLSMYCIRQFFNHSLPLLCGRHTRIYTRGKRLKGQRIFFFVGDTHSFHVRYRMLISIHRLHRTRGQWPCSASGQAVYRGCGGRGGQIWRELKDLNYLCSHISMSPTCHYSQDHCYSCLSKMASEAADGLGGHFWPRRSYLTSDVESGSSR